MNAVQTTTATRSTFAKAALGTIGALTIAASAFFAQLPAVAQADASQSIIVPSAAQSSDFEAQIIDLVNQDRAAYGLGPVEFDPSLLATARDRAAAQIPQPSLNHYDTDGKLAFVKLLARDGVSYYSLAGENLARLPGLDDGTAARAEDALMHSPTHRANILQPTYNHIAVGATMDSNGRVILAQIFGSY
jgi:uncharacterized protein YkwD